MQDTNSTLPGNEPRRFTDAQTDKRIHEHLTNAEDEITEDDIRNIKTEIIGETDVNSLVKPVPAPVQDVAEPSSKDITDNTDPDVDTTWNVLK